MSKEKKKHNALNSIVTTLCLLIIIALFGYTIINNFLDDKFNKIEQVSINTDIESLGIIETTTTKSGVPSNYRNILFLGSDSQRDDFGEDNRTDCIIICSINKNTNKVNVFSIYRDTYLQMETNRPLEDLNKYKVVIDSTDENGKSVVYDKANSAFYDGVQNTIKTINTNLDLNISEYALVTFSGVCDMVDAVGGIDITIDSEELKYINGYITNVSKVTGKPGNKINTTGTIHMDGVQACSYCRIRYTDGRDMKRAERMRTVLEKVISKLKTMSVGDINSFLDEVLDDFQTNIPVKDIKALIPSALSSEIESSFGWPYETTGVWQNNNFYGPANTTESNVKKLHVELFGQEDYEVPEKVVNISDRIVEITGVGKK